MPTNVTVNIFLYQDFRLMAVKIHLLVTMPAAYSSKIFVSSNEAKTWCHNTEDNNTNISVC
jgi:hypothetical protein